MLLDLDTVLNFLTCIIFIEFISLIFMWMNVIAICLNLFIAWVALFKDIQNSYRILAGDNPMQSTCLASTLYNNLDDDE